MRFWRLRKRRSSGIPVSAAVHRLLKAGDAARGHDWSRAAALYRDALAAMPGLAHIWIQLGHALGEQGDGEGADAAYRQALAAGADMGEVHVHLGHVANRSGDWPQALWHYSVAVRHGRDDGLHNVAEQARRSIPAEAGFLKLAMLDHGGADGDFAASRPSADRTASGHAVTYDVSDLIAHFRRFRLPTGIQRIQLEVLARALAAAPHDTRICCLVRGRDDLIELPQTLFSTLETLSRSSGDTSDSAWLAAIARLSVHSMAAPSYRFITGECLVNLGTSWSDYNYFLMIRNAKASHGIRYVAMVYDLVPVYAPQFCVGAVTQDYLNWLVGAFVHADHFLADSQSTARDLVRAGEQLGHGNIAGRVTVVPLDADFRSQMHGGGSGTLTRYALMAGGYALLVSTIEPRKNHLLALQAWARLLCAYPADQIPTLVLVGRPGWLNERVYAYLHDNPVVAAKIVFVERVSDAGLAELYQGCAFTVYPSLYEGWGLPVTEALCYGKLPVVAENSSLIEAGGDVAAFFESGSIDDLMRVLERAIFDHDWREARERDIAERFRPRTWQQIADSIILLTSMVTQSTIAIDPTEALPGRFYPFGLYRGLGLWPGLDSGERLRTGEGWLLPEAGFCRIAPGRATIRIMPPRAAAWTILLLLVGIDEGQCPFRVVAANALVEGSIDPGVTRWSRPITVATASGMPLDVMIEAPFGEVETLIEEGVERRRIVSIGVAGVYFYAEDDKAAAARVLAAGLGRDVDRISTFSPTAEWADDRLSA